VGRLPLLLSRCILAHYLFVPYATGTSSLDGPSSLPPALGSFSICRPGLSISRKKTTATVYGRRGSMKEAATEAALLPGPFRRVVAFY
jgi:hypothetical protein